MPRPHPRHFLIRRIAVLASIGLVGGVLASPPATAGHAHGYQHDHSALGTPRRPYGLTDLRATFGEHCNTLANDSRSWFPSAVARNVAGYVYYHPYLARNVKTNIRGHSNAAHKDGSIDYGVYGYDCRPKRGSSAWSVHSFGAAIDTNSYRNQFGQTYWNGIGADGADHGLYIPNLWRAAAPGHNFFWGLNFSGTKDPHHFQYVKGY
jgi:hypothetical protein